MEFVIVWIVLVIVWSILAERKNRSVGGWTLLAVFLPIVVLILLALPSLEADATSGAAPAKTAKKTENGKQAGAQVASDPEEKPCPMCAETVKFAAKICRFCGHEFETFPEEPQPDFFSERRNAMEEEPRQHKDED